MICGSFIDKGPTQIKFASKIKPPAKSLSLDIPIKILLFKKINIIGEVLSRFLVFSEHLLKHLMIFLKNLKIIQLLTLSCWSVRFYMRALAEWFGSVPRCNGSQPLVNRDRLKDLGHFWIQSTFFVKDLIDRESQQFFFDYFLELFNSNLLRICILTVGALFGTPKILVIPSILFSFIHSFEWFLYLLA